MHQYYFGNPALSQDGNDVSDYTIVTIVLKNQRGHSRYRT